MSILWRLEAALQLSVILALVLRATVYRERRGRGRGMPWVARRLGTTTLTLRNALDVLIGTYPGATWPVVTPIGADTVIVSDPYSWPEARDPGWSLTR